MYNQIEEMKARLEMLQAQYELVKHKPEHAFKLEMWINIVRSNITWEEAKAKSKGKKNAV